MIPTRFALGLAVAGLFVGACDSKTNADPSAPTKAGGGTIAGKATTADGRPIVGQVQVSYDGWPEGQLGTMQGNGRIASPASGHVDAANGRYEIPLPPGQYTTEALATVKWHDKDYTFKLEAADGIDDTARVPVTADKGVARDYVWKMTGTRPGQDPAYLGSGWDRAVYGASIGIDLGAWDTENYRPSQPIFEAADKPSSIEFTLAPKGKLIDGSDGKTIVERVKVSENGHYGFGLRGIPVGDYTCSAKLIQPDGAATPLHVSLTPAEYVTPHVDTKTRVAWKDSVDVVFPPVEGVLRYLGADRVTVYVGK